MAMVIVAKKMTLVDNGVNHTPKTGPFEMDDARAAALYSSGVIRYHGEVPAPVTIADVEPVKATNLTAELPAVTSMAPQGKIMVEALESVNHRVHELLIDSGIETVDELLEMSIDDLVSIKGIGKATAESLLREANALNGDE